MHDRFIWLKKIDSFIFVFLLNYLKFLSIDDGDVYLCPQDWSKEHVFGNVFSQHLMDVWNSAMFNEYRNVLLNHRDTDPCKNCNTCGLVYGNQYQEVWRNHYDKS